jgi:hypothetical protein
MIKIVRSAAWTCRHRNSMIEVRSRCSMEPPGRVLNGAARRVPELRERRDPFKIELFAAIQ